MAVLGYLNTAALKGALDLDLFSAIPETDGTAEAIAARVQASPRGVRILCDFLTVNGFLRKEAQHYRLTPSTAMFLTRSSPAWLGSVVDFLAAPEFLRLWIDDPVSYVRNGGSVGLANTAPDNPLWVTFAKAMVPFMTAPADALAAEVRGWNPPVRRVVDISAGHGLYGIAIGKAVPGAEIIAVDWAPVLKVAEANAAAAGLAGPLSAAARFGIRCGLGQRSRSRHAAQFPPSLRSRGLHRPSCQGPAEPGRKRSGCRGRVCCQ